MLLVLCINDNFKIQVWDNLRLCCTCPQRSRHIYLVVFHGSLTFKEYLCINITIRFHQNAGIERDSLAAVPSLWLRQSGNSHLMAKLPVMGTDQPCFPPRTLCYDFCGHSPPYVCPHDTIDTIPQLCRHLHILLICSHLMCESVALRSQLLVLIIFCFSFTTFL